MDVLAARDPNAWGADGSSSSKGRSGGKGGLPGSECTPAGGGTAGPSPLTQQPSMQRPGTPSATQPGPGATAGAQLADDASSAWGEQQAAAARLPPGLPASRPGSGQHQQRPANQQGQQTWLSRPDTAASSAAVDIGDVRRLVATVESLQRQVRLAPVLLGSAGLLSVRHACSGPIN